MVAALGTQLRKGRRPKNRAAAVEGLANKHLVTCAALVIGNGGAVDKGAYADNDGDVVDGDE